MTLADTLSHLPCTTNKDTINLDVRIDLVRFNSDHLNDIRNKTRKDSALNQLHKVIITGWPDSVKVLSPAIHSYWSYRDELSVNDGILLKGTRIWFQKINRKTS